MTSRDDYLNAMQERQDQQKVREDKAALLTGLIRDRDQRLGAELVERTTPRRPNPEAPLPGETRIVQNNSSTSKHIY